jgi:hypothetical protein
MSTNEPQISNKKDNLDYGTWGLLVGIVSFIGIWIYAISEWGLLLGLTFGWIPSLIGGIIAGLLWPITIAVVILILIKL